MTEGHITTANGDHDLPDGWALPQVGEILSVNYGKGLPAKRRSPGKVPVYGSNGVIGYHSKSLTSGPTIVVGRKGTVGAVHFSQEPCWPIDTTYFIEQFNGLEPGYVYHGLRCLNLAELDTSTAIPGLNRDELYDQRLPLAPLAEQKRIMAKIEELLAHVNATRERLAKVPAILKRFRQAVLAAACSGRLTEDWREKHSDTEPAAVLLKKIREFRLSKNEKQKGKPSRIQKSQEETRDSELSKLPDSWTWCRVGEIATVNVGGTPSRKIAQYWCGDIPWVSSGEVANCRITKTVELISANGLENSNAKIYPKGSVLIAMIGEGKTRGQAAILAIEACTNQNVAGLIFDANSVNAKYVWSWALSQYEQNRAQGRGGNQPALNGQKVRELQLPLPPLKEQDEIVRRLNGLLELVDVIERRVGFATQKTEMVTHAILAKGFHGELVPTEAELARRGGRFYEPGIELLSRITAARRVVNNRARKTSNDSGLGRKEFV